jgi:hypothetical protein
MQRTINKRRFAALTVFLLAIPLLAACGGKYYEVSEAGSSKTYYTRDIDRDEGRLRFRDEATGDKVRLDSSEVREISQQQYKNAVGK